ncbi:LapA family protein [Texcoconibacillus texcoconensis]|uniref:Putative integral membrane protein n=1 Tax=Texcoconibacillus texcoconensis TaxID=1095777 RepID=A0A840QPA7_9BACI|nr:lipopolysaccharide assembly protein LapA domain-containing protein [Texcoconibacillus texcoconensis]MBB5173200.1 putative integral membrane protein [Texcoconibacillus texcoconensis]
MKGQWGLIVGLVVVFLITIFAVINVDPVEVNYLFGQAEWPLVLVIIGSVVMGAVIVGGVGMYKLYYVQQDLRQVKQENERLKERLASKEKSSSNEKQKNDNKNKKQE